MAEFPAVQDMDTFLINPTVKADAEDVDSQPHNISGDLIPIFVADKILTVKAGKSAVQSTGPLRSLVDESIFSRGYNSEEEAASPTEDNDFGFQSTDTESNPSIREAPSVEELSEKFNALQLCTKAQAVQIVSAGKAKIVSVPSPTEGSYFERRTRTSTESQASARIPRFEIPVRVSSDAQRRSPRTSSEASPATPTSQAFSEQNSRPREIRRKPRLPPLQAAPTSNPPRSTRTQTPLAMQRAELAKQDSSPSSGPFGSPVSPSSPSSPKRKTTKFSPTFNFRFGRPRRSDSTASSSSGGSERYSYMEYHAVSTSPVTVDRTNNPAPSVKNSMPKMVPRGASERAPPITIPPCPSDFAFDEGNIDYESDWPLRKDSVFAMSGSGNAFEQIRRKSMAVALVTTQA